MVRGRVLVSCGVALALVGWSGLRAPSAWAQRPYSIYPVYDGYMKNDDGTLTLSFAYFSHNRVPVTIPVGPDNGFSPGPADRGQPTNARTVHESWPA